MLAAKHNSELTLRKADCSPRQAVSQASRGQKKARMKPGEYRGAGSYAESLQPTSKKWTVGLYRLRDGAVC